MDGRRQNIRTASPTALTGQKSVTYIYIILKGFFLHRKVFVDAGMRTCTLVARVVTLTSTFRDRISQFWVNLTNFVNFIRNALFFRYVNVFQNAWNTCWNQDCSEWKVWNDEKQAKRRTKSSEEVTLLEHEDHKKGSNQAKANFT